MVHVPVDDGHALDAAAAGKLGAQRRVREEAVAVGLRRLGVVAGRAHERVRLPALAVQHRFGRRIETFVPPCLPPHADLRRKLRERTTRHARLARRRPEVHHRAAHNQQRQHRPEVFSL